MRFLFNQQNGIEVEEKLHKIIQFMENLKVFCNNRDLYNKMLIFILGLHWIAMSNFQSLLFYCS